MIFQKMNIWEDSSCDMRTEATLEVYVPDNSPEIDMERTNQAVLICPGGGYQGVSDREAEPIALALAGEGICAFVLRYSVAPNRYPTQLLEASRAMQLIRQNAEAWHVDTDDIAVMGFSAGGHLAAHLATKWNDPMLCERLNMQPGMNKPNRVILGYAVTTSHIPGVHQITFYNLFGDDAGDEVFATASTVELVGEHTPKAFIWHTASDGIVPVEHSLLFAGALQKHHIPFELHIYPEGNHGLSLSDRRSSGGHDDLIQPHPAQWFGACVRWLKEC